jgi:hypothetical protein
LDHGIDSFELDHLKAKNDLDRIIEVRWFRSFVRSRIHRFAIELLYIRVLYDPNLFLNPSQLKKASVYRVLGYYAFPRLSKSIKEPDRWAMKAAQYEKMFEDELNLVLEVGLDYDWDKNGVIDLFEKEVSAGAIRVDRA